MLFFLRQIRRKTLKNNKVFTYLLYAMGEIVLVVVGILIAVSIDDWNDQRKEAQVEVEILKGLRSDLKQNVQKINRMMSLDSMVIKRNETLIKTLMDQSTNYHDSLSFYFGSINNYSTFSPQKMAYQNLQVKGLGSIKNDSLRAELIELYDETYFHNTHIGERKSQQSHDSNFILNKRLFTLQNINQRVPDDFEVLKNDREFINVISYITADRRSMLYQAAYMLKSTNSLIEMIDQEINN